MKKLVLLLAIAISAMGLKAQGVGSYTIVEYNGYTLQFTVKSTSPAECIIAGVELTTETMIDVITLPSTALINGTEFTVTSIAREGFAYWYSVEKFELPNTITSIGEKAFYYCNFATEITIPESVTTIGNSAFYGCAITDVVIPNGVTKIDKGVFSRCTALTNIEIPNTVTFIGAQAFYYCTSLTQIELPENITTIEDYAFSGCSNLSLVKLYATTPPTCNKIFVDVPEDMIIRVPQVAIDLYLSTSPWNKYDVRAIETEGLDENVNSLGVYPNPVKDNLFIETETNIEEVSIFNATGALINNVQCTMNNVQLDITELNSGVYFVKVRTSEGETVRRFIKK